MTRKKATPTRETLGDRIRRQRLAKALTQAELGTEIGVSQRVVAYYENKGSSPRPEVLARIADVLDTSVDALLGRRKAASNGAVTKEPERDVRHQRHLKRLDELPLNDRKAIFRIIDALASRNAKRRREG